MKYGEYIIKYGGAELCLGILVFKKVIVIFEREQFFGMAAMGCILKNCSLFLHNFRSRLLFWCNKAWG